MGKALFPETTGHESSKPEANGTPSSSDMRDALSALYQGDLSPLRVRAQDTPDMTVAINPTLIENFFQQVFRDGQPRSYAGGNSPAISAPSANPRIDILYLKNDDTVAWITGDEAASPVPKYSSLPEDGIPLAEVYCKTTMTKIVNYEDKDTYSSDGYIYKDVRPFLRIDVGGANSDSTAIHDNEAGEISAITEKATPASTDLLLIEDSEDSNNKKKVQVGNSGLGLRKIEVNQTAASDSVLIQDGGIDVLRIYDGGIIDMPKQSGCNITLSAQQSGVVTATETKVLLDSEIWDIHNEFDNITNHRWTCGKPGRYLIIAVVGYNRSGSGCEYRAQIYKNGSCVINAILEGVGGTYTFPLTVSILDIGLNDYIELWAYHTTGVDATLYNGVDTTRLSIIKLN